MFTESLTADTGWVIKGIKEINNGVLMSQQTLTIILYLIKLFKKILQLKLKEMYGN